MGRDARFYILDTARVFPPMAGQLRYSMVLIPADSSKPEVRTYMYIVNMPVKYICVYLCNEAYEVAYLITVKSY